MKQRLLIIAVTAALLLSGWSGALAAVCCPREERDAAHPFEAATDAMETDEAHACCVQRQADEASASCPMSQKHDAEAAPTHHEATSNAEKPRDDAANTETSNTETSAHVVRYDAGRTHCASCTRNLPASPVVVREPIGAKRDAGDMAAPHESSQIALPTPLFVRKIVPSQHAPPGQNVRRHVLLSVFLI